MKNLILLLVCVLVVCSLVFSQVPNKISYQGLLTTSSGTPVQDGSYNLQFDIYNLPSGGSLKHTETLSGVLVQKGTFSVILHPPTTIFAESLFVEIIAVGGPGISGSITFSPRSVLTSAAYSLAPWIKNGNNIYYNAGKVGIGTTSPTASLHVFSNSGGAYILHENSTTSAFGIRLMNPIRDWYLIHSPAGQDRFCIYDATAGMEPLSVLPSGNVGIGTSVPSTKLEVAGQIKITGGSPGTGKVLTSDASGLASWQVGFDGVNMGKIYTNTSGNILTTRSGGNVLYWDAANGEIELTNTSGDWCDYWWQSQKGITTAGNSGALATGNSNVAIISGTNSNDYGFEIHFGQADGTSGWCSVWLQFANGALVGHYIKY